MAIDIDAARQDTPACNHHIHLNNAGASLIPLPVQQAVAEHLALEYELGGYEAYDARVAAYQSVYANLAKLINCQPDELAYASNSSNAWAMGFYAMGLQPGDKVLTTMAEYNSNYMMLLLARQRGLQVQVVPDDVHGQLDLDALQAAIDSNTKLITLVHMPTNSGLINPIREACAIARARGVLTIVDACQSLGQLHIDVQDMGCDMLSAAGRKYLRGPRGTAMLYVRREVMAQLQPVVMDNFGTEWRSAEVFASRAGGQRFELFEKNVAAMMGLGRAAEYAMQWGTQNIEQRCLELGQLLRNKLATIPRVQVYQRGLRQGAIVTFTVQGADHQQLFKQLAVEKVAVRVAPADAARLDMDPRGMASLIRASAHYYNTEQELESFASILADLLK